MINHEDVVAMAFLFNTAESYKFVGKYGIFYIARGDSASRHPNPLDINIYNIYLTDVIIDFSKDTYENKIVIAHFILGLMKHKKIKETLFLDNDYKDLFISCIDRALKNKYISDELKNEIRKEGKKLEFLDYNF